MPPNRNIFQEISLNIQFDMLQLYNVGQFSFKLMFTRDTKLLSGGFVEIGIHFLSEPVMLLYCIMLEFGTDYNLANSGVYDFREISKVKMSRNEIIETKLPHNQISSIIIYDIKYYSCRPWRSDYCSFSKLGVLNRCLESRPQGS